MLFADLLSLHLVTFLMFFILVYMLTLSMDIVCIATGVLLHHPHKVYNEHGSIATLQNKYLFPISRMTILDLGSV